MNVAWPGKTTVYRSLNKKRRRMQVVLKRHGISSHLVRNAAVATFTTGAFAGHVLAHPTTPPQPSDTDTLHHSLQPDPDLPALTSAVPLGPPVQLPPASRRVATELAAEVATPTKTLTAQDEGTVLAILEKYYQIPVTAELDGVRLASNYGQVGGEQHLPLFPGDTLANHRTDPTVHLTGMVPGLPAWGYFESSKKAVTTLDRQREEYYIAVQTFLVSGWRQKSEALYTWFRYRKMVIVNPQNGSAVIVDVADSGPSPYTGKTFGASNETIISLGLGLERVGSVYVFFVDDPNNSIPLGPLATP